MASPRRAFAAIALLSLLSAVSAQCQTGFTLCQPSGASSTTIPSTGPGLAPLYNDLLNSVQDIKLKERFYDAADALAPRDTPFFCCNEGTSCINLSGFNIPMCYDRFTTNFRLLNGASGTIDSGDFTGSDGGSANLQNGSYTGADKSLGNMYSGSGASQSPTNSGAIPTPFTGTGVGSAIPISALGIVQTLLVTVPETTIPATTLPGTTIEGTTDAGTTVTPQTAPSTVPGTTLAGTTLAGTTQGGRTQAATTVAAHTSLITTTVASAAATTSSKAGAMRIGNDAGIGAGLAGLVAAAAMLL